MLENRRNKNFSRFTTLDSLYNIFKEGKMDMKNFKKCLICLLACFLCLGLTACGSSSDTNRLDEIKQRGKLILATSPDYAPMEFINPNKSGQESYVGSDIALAYYIAEKLGVELEIMAMDFSTALSSVNLGQADIAIAGFGWKEKRATSFELSIGYNQTGEASCQGLMVKADKLNDYTSLDDFAGLKIVAQSGSLQEGYVNEQLSDSTLQLVTDLGLAVEMLKSDKVDAFACSCEQMDAYAKANPEIARSTVEFDTTVESMHDGNVAAVKKGETELIEAINAILEEVNASGIYDTWYSEAVAIARDLGLEFEE